MIMKSHIGVLGGLAVTGTVVMAVVAAGCAGDSTESSSTSAPPATTPVSSAAAPTAPVTVPSTPVRRVEPFTPGSKPRGSSGFPSLESPTSSGNGEHRGLVTDRSASASGSARARVEDTGDWLLDS